MTSVRPHLGIGEVERMTAKLREALRVMSKDDGSLPDIEFDFGPACLVPAAYSVVMHRATHLVGASNYWSTSLKSEVSFGFGENPAVAIENGEADPFHVLFGGLVSSNGHSIPDLGFFVLSPSDVAFDYRMGAEWDIEAVIGLFELIQALLELSATVKLKHVGNLYDNGALLAAFKEWGNDAGTRVGPNS